MVDERGAGLHVPLSPLRPGAGNPFAPASIKKEEPALAGPGPVDALWVAQERIRQSRHHSSEQAVEMVQRDQRICALTAERDWLASQLEEERGRRLALEPELDVARNEWASTEKRANEFQEGFYQNSIQLQQALLDLEQLTRQVDLAKSERTEAVLELTTRQEQFGELSLEVERARAERRNGKDRPPSPGGRGTARGATRRAGPFRRGGRGE